MPDKNNPQRYEKTINTPETGFETLRATVSENKTQLSAIQGKLSQMAASNEEMKKGFQNLCDFLKKDPPDKTISRSPGRGKSGTHQVIPRSPNPGIHHQQPQTPTHIGTIADNVVVDDYGRIMNL